MKAIMIMFDTLSRRFLSTYGNPWVKTPNFERLKKQSIQFDNFYCGSLPCMPARRELHTGRYNFLHRGWGPLEPFDVSAIELLKDNGVYTHIITDHSHYWEDGGATYLPRYNSWEGFRGQEGDRWIGVVNKESIKIPKQLPSSKHGVSLYHNWANREQVKEEKDYSSAQTVEAGIQFIKRNNEEDNWFLQIECFDPHEPFMVPERFLALYDDVYVGEHFDWPAYASVVENEQERAHLIKEYAGLISMCDDYLGKILDVIDELNLWEDTMLIVNTDHGFLMGEHDWWGKNIQPCYNEISHLPFYIYNPQNKTKGITKNELCQTIDIAPTLLDFFGVVKPDVMLGMSIIPAVEEKSTLHDSILFGSFGHHVNVYDGKYIYMRAPISYHNKPLFDYTLMPTTMRGFMGDSALSKSTLVDLFSFCKGMNVLKVPSESFFSGYQFGNKLFDVEVDNEQKVELDEIDIEIEMIEKMRQLMILNEAPEEQYERLGILKDRCVTKAMLQQQRHERIKAFEISSDIILTLEQTYKLAFLRQLVEGKLDLDVNNEYKMISKNNTLLTPDSIIETLFSMIMNHLHIDGQHRGLFLSLLNNSTRIN